MRHALILPVPLLRDYGLRAHREKNLPPLHLCLSHLTRSSFPMARHYVTYFAERREAGDYIVMDNGADESTQGKGDAITLTLEAARRVRAQEIVLPDVQLNSQGTIHNTLRALDWLETYEGRKQYEICGHPRLMIVPQGRTIIEWVECAKALLAKTRHFLYQLNGPSLVVGVAKQYHDLFKTGREGGRFRQVRWLYEQLGEYEEVHLLGYPRGAHDAPLIDREWPGFIRSVDSAKPVVYAMNTMVPQSRTDLPPYPKRPKDYFQQGLDKIERGYLEANIQFFCYG